jgi:hypothetical protein
MAILENIQSQLTRTSGLITTNAGLQSILQAKVNNLTATPEEILQLDNITNVILPDLTAKSLALDEISSKFGINLGSFGTVDGILNQPTLFSSKTVAQINNFLIPDCTSGIIDAINSTLKKIGEAADHLMSLVSQAINDAFGDSLSAIQNYLNSLLSFMDKSTVISDALNSISNALSGIASAIKAAMLTNPCAAAVADKLMTFQTPEDQSLYNGLKAAINDPKQKAELIKGAYDRIKIL